MTDSISDLYRLSPRKALRKLFDTYYEPLLLYCYRLVQDREGAEDIVQEIFVNLWKSDRLSSFEGKVEPFLYRAVRYRSANYLRDLSRRRRMHASSGYGGGIALPELPEDREGDRLELLYRTVDRLPEQCRRIFLSAVMDDLKYQEIALRLGISVNTVKTQMKIAFRFLREQLDREDFVSLLFLFMEKYGR